SNINVNDVLGDYLLTLVDTLDALAVLGDKDAFAQAVENTIKFLPDFNIDSHVQVFEVTIRMLGGLLSAHIIASDEKDTLGMRLDTDGTYNGELLGLARDLAYRLLPAFEASPNGIPYPRTNLKYGFLRGETPETCSAGAGTLLLEFGTLSRLTNETIFEDIARHAMNELWTARSKKNLFGNVFDLERRKWVTPTASISAGLDSLYEYMLKSYVYFGDPQYLKTFEISYSALLQYARDTVGGYAFYNVDMRSAEVTSTWIDSLSAYFPGLMVLAGDVDGAESAYMAYYHLWRRFRAMPERFNMFLREPDVIFYPLRPEFIESTYFLYRATRDPFYLDVGEMVLADLNALQRTRCGYASMQNVNSRNLEERMESFLLSETFKYLYLLFDEENPLHSLDNNYVFTTEGHVLLPLSAPHQGSAQYPNGTSFPKRKLIHLEQPPKAVKPLFYQVGSIRQKLEAVHPDDMFATPVSDGKGASDDGASNRKSGAAKSHKSQMPGEPRKCPVPRSIGVSVKHLTRPADTKETPDTAGSSGGGHGSERKEHDQGKGSSVVLPDIQLAVEWQSSHMQSPLTQLYAMHELAKAVNGRAGKGIAEKKHLLSLLANHIPLTMPMRSDFYNIGMLVSSSKNHINGVRFAESRNGTAVLQGSLQLALEYSGMCSLPSRMFLSQRQELWPAMFSSQVGNASDAYCIRNPPMDAETWLSPNTRQIPFMDFLLSQACGVSAMTWSIPHRPKIRHGVPLLKNVWDEMPDQADAWSGSYSSRQHQSSSSMLHPANSSNGDPAQQPKRRGYPPIHSQNQQQQQQQQQLIITNGAGHVMTDYVIVRMSTDDSLHEFVRALPVHNDSVSGKELTAMPTAHSIRDRDEDKENNNATDDAEHNALMQELASDRGADKVNSGSQDQSGTTNSRYSGKVQTRPSVGREEHQTRPHPHLNLESRHRQRDYAGRLAEFAEMALYRGHPAYLVSDPTTLIMLHLYSSSSVYG
ncbi:hypothetical protein GGI12_005240, partial [Dipsacomyces acuminosporus]